MRNDAEKKKPTYNVKSLAKWRRQQVLKDVLHRSLISKFSLKIAEFFAVFFQNFARIFLNLPIFDQIFSGFFQNAAAAFF